MTTDALSIALTDLCKARTYVLAAMALPKQPVARGNMTAALTHLDRASKVLKDLSLGDAAAGAAKG